MRNRLPLFLAFAGVAALITLTVVRSRDGGVDATTAGALTAPATSGTSLPTVTNTASTPRASYGPPVTSVPGVIEGMAAAERQRDAEIARLEAVWARDTRDAAATTTTLAAVNAAIEDGAMTRGARFAPDGVIPDCRRTLCRIEAKFAPGTDGNEWATRLLLDMAGRVGTASTFTIPDGKGGSRIVLYAFRDGHAPARAP